MSFLFSTPDLMAVAASDLADIGSAVSVADVSAAARTTALVVAGEDEVSAAIAGLFSSHAREYQALSSQVAVFHERFVQALSAGASAYATAEAANVSPLQEVLNVINAPTQALLGRPLIGDGANATTPGGNGGAGGLLVGNGGTGAAGGG